MRILYVASDQTLPGETGGSVHVHEVSRALAKRGHEVHAVVQDRGRADAQGDGYSIKRIRWSPSHRFFRFRARPQVEALIELLKPDVVMERYYNFGGEGILAAEAAGIPEPARSELAGGRSPRVGQGDARCPSHRAAHADLSGTPGAIRVGPDFADPRHRARIRATQDPLRQLGSEHRNLPSRSAQ